MHPNVNLDTGVSQLCGIVQTRAPQGTDGEWHCTNQESVLHDSIHHVSELGSH
jgi:hypothetical protein